MTTYARLLAILVAVSGIGLSAVAAAGDTSKDTWKGAWKFEIDRQDQPSLNYYDSTGKTVFRIGCWTHFEMDAVYPGADQRRSYSRATRRGGLQRTSPSCRNCWARRKDKE